MDSIKKIVVIGAMGAGLRAACHLKRSCPDIEVTVLEKDDFISYNSYGIPYYICGDVADETQLCSTSFQMVRDVSYFRKVKGIRVLPGMEVLKIDRTAMVVYGQDVKTGMEEQFSYDRLLIATGGEPYVPEIAGTDLDGVFTVASLSAAVVVKQRIARGMVGTAVVVGGGATGIEMAEALSDLWGVKTTLVEAGKQLLPTQLDWSCAAMLTTHLEKNGTTVHTGEEVVAINGDNSGVQGVQTDKRTIEADLVILATGVRPDSQLAADAGLAITPLGGVMVNRRFESSDPHIYAVGRCVTSINLITGREEYRPSGSLAIRQGRAAGDAMTGLPVSFPGQVGTFIIKAFDCSVMAAGLTRAMAEKEGFATAVARIVPYDREHFYPGKALIVIEMVFDRKTRKVLGVQGFGMMNDTLLSRVNTAALLIGKQATIDDCIAMETAYAPPFSLDTDPLAQAASVADNLCSCRLRQVSLRRFLAWMEDFSLEPDWIVMDIRNEVESAPFVEKIGIDKWFTIPYEEVRLRLDELPVDKTIIIACNSGHRTYDVQNFLDQFGSSETMVLGGGLNVIRRLGVGWLPGGE